MAWAAIFRASIPWSRKYNQSGELFQIEGHCRSACTLFLAIRNVCIDRNATLLFQAGHNRQREMTNSATSHMLGAYNAALREHVTTKHYMETLAFNAIFGGRDDPELRLPRVPQIGRAGAFQFPAGTRVQASHRKAAGFPVAPKIVFFRSAICA